MYGSNVSHPQMVVVMNANWSALLQIFILHRLGSRYCETLTPQLQPLNAGLWGCALFWGVSCMLKDGE